jgi:hypothetical protein
VYIFFFYLNYSILLIEIIILKNPLFEKNDFFFHGDLIESLLPLTSNLTCSWNKNWIIPSCILIQSLNHFRFLFPINASSLAQTQRDWIQRRYRIEPINTLKRRILRCRMHSMVICKFSIRQTFYVFRFFLINARRRVPKIILLLSSNSSNLDRSWNFGSQSHYLLKIASISYMAPKVYMMIKMYIKGEINYYITFEFQVLHPLFKFRLLDIEMSLNIWHGY